VYRSLEDATASQCTGCSAREKLLAAIPAKRARLHLPIALLQSKTAKDRLILAARNSKIDCGLRLPALNLSPAAVAGVVRLLVVGFRRVGKAGNDCRRDYHRDERKTNEKIVHLSSSFWGIRGRYILTASNQPQNDDALIQ